jgi:hypothetical protein
VTVGLIQIVQNRASTMYQERDDFINEIISLRTDLQRNGPLQGFIDWVINYKGSNHQKEEKSLGEMCVCVPL